MAQVLTLAQIQSIMQSLVTGFIPGANPDSTVRTTWPPVGQPGFEAADNVVFLRITYEDDAYTRFLELTYEPDTDASVTVNQSYTVTLRCDITIYGPEAFDNADVIRSSLFLPATTATLAASNLALITDVPMPRRAPELYNAQWWERVDLSARFNELVVRSSTAPAIATAPVTLLNQEGGA